MELSRVDTSQELRRSVAQLLHRRVSVTVGWIGDAGPLVCLSGHLDGLVEVPGGSDAPLSLVVAGQDIMLWPEDLERATVVTAQDGIGFAVQFDSGLAISVDRTD